MANNYLTNVSSLSENPSIVRHLKTDLDRLEYLESLLFAYASNGFADNEHYRELRMYFLDNPDTGILLPRWLTTFKSLAAVWEFLRFQGSTTDARKLYISEGLTPLRDHLEAQRPVYIPSTSVTPDIAQKLNPVAQTEAEEPSLWQKAKDEAWDNPDGAATMGIMAFEATLQSLLSEQSFSTSEPVPNGLGIYALFQELSKRLELYPGLQHSVSFSSVLDGMAEIVSGLDLMSSEIGEVTTHSRLSPGQAELTIRMAQSIAEFLSESVLSLKEI